MLLKYQEKKGKEKEREKMIQDISPKKLLLPYKESLPKKDDTVFVFRGSNKREDNALIRVLEDGHILAPTCGQLMEAGAVNAESHLQYLFAIDEKEYYLLNNGGAEDISLPGFTYERVRTFCDGRIVDDMSLAGMTAYHLFFWYRDNMCCGRCGHKMIPFSKERAVQCPACHNLVFPKLMPAVIMLVKDGEKLVVSRYKDREYTGIALLAGFCEIGESLEQTVEREVEEEVGLHVKDITYFGSQPWGVDSNLLMGFYADVDGSREIHRDKQELAKAVWIDRSEIQPQKNLASLTMTMLEAFRTGAIQ